MYWARQCTHRGDNRRFLNPGLNSDNIANLDNKINQVGVNTVGYTLLMI